MLEFVEEISRYHFPTTIDFGVGARNLIAPQLKSLDCSRPMIVTDRGLAKLPPVVMIRSLLEDAGLHVAVFDGVVGNPMKQQVGAGVESFRAHGADCIVAIGGGAPVDVAKVIALMVEHPGDLFDYEDGMPDARSVDKPIPYLVAVPTTAGTGSEVGRSAVVSDDETHIKKIIFSPRILPKHVFADPELTVELPAHITAATGMDALTHLIEAYLAKGFNPMCDGIALEGIRLVAASLQQSVRFARTRKNVDEFSPEDRNAHLGARSAMLNAAIMGAVAFQKGLGVTHSCAHALSTVCDLHHGLANGIMLVSAMKFNRQAVPGKFEYLSKLIDDGENDFISWLEHLRDEIGIPRYLGDVGVSDNHLETLVDHAMTDPCHQLNPRPVTKDDMTVLFAGALGPKM